ncbi:hypothetical protein MferCBS31731_005608 [Microsporum ferrugineum]
MGINYRIFNGPCRELSNFTTMLEQPGFKCLDLALALLVPYGSRHLCNRGPVHGAYHFPPVSFPVYKWSKLRHFALSSFHVVQSDILDLLDTTPATLRTVELSQLLFIKNWENYNSLLTGMRDTLGWKDSAVENWPQVTFWVRKPSAMLNAYGAGRKQLSLW